MTLEDHLGDILRKARRAAGVTEEAATKAASLSQDALAELESSGNLPSGANLAALGRLVGLHEGKLAGIAKGWLPQERDLGQWRELRMIPTTRGGNLVNAYLLWDEVSREAALFDTGWEAGKIFELVDGEQLQLKHLFLTHTHEDHIAALDEIKARFPKILLHSNAKNALPQHRNRPNDFIHLGSLRITNRDTPGHAEDGVIYVVSGWPEDAPPVAIIGDTIFAGSMATGFQSAAQLQDNVRQKIFTLPPETLLGPGHGPVTTVAEEKEHNPFF